VISNREAARLAHLTDEDRAWESATLQRHRDIQAREDALTQQRLERRASSAIEGRQTIFIQRAKERRVMDDTTLRRLWHEATVATEAAHRQCIGSGTLLARQAQGEQLLEGSALRLTGNAMATRRQADAWTHAADAWDAVADAHAERLRTRAARA
jgi:hypothetical protein